VTVYLPGSDETDPKKIVMSLQQLGAGRSNATGAVTLTVNVATTTVVDNNCAAGSAILMMPTTANAATEVGNGTMYIATATVLNKSFVITHANAATTGRTFRYAIVG
jgi:hypothetical protein